MQGHWKSFVLTFLGSLTITVLSLILLQFQLADHTALSRCSENDIKIQKPVCISALQDSLNVHFIACSADRALLSIGSKLDDATKQAAGQYAQQKSLEIPENLASQELIAALKNETTSCELAPAVAVIDSATVSHYESSSGNQISDSSTSSSASTSTDNTSSVQNSKISESPPIGLGSSGASTGAGSSGVVAAQKWMELGTVYPEYASQNATVKLYACTQGGAIKTKYTVQSTSYSSSTQFRFALTDDAYNVLYRYSASTVKTGGSYESSGTYSPTQRVHPGIYTGSGDSASWSYLQKAFNVGDIIACA